VRTTHETVCPRLKPVTTGANTESTTAAEILHMFVDVDCGGETGDDVAFDGEPAVRVVADRGVGADESGVDNVRLKAINLDAQANLPAVIIAIAIDEIRFGSGARREPERDRRREWRVRSCATRWRRPRIG